MLHSKEIKKKFDIIFKVFWKKLIKALIFALQLTQVRGILTQHDFFTFDKIKVVPSLWEMKKFLKLIREVVRLSSALNRNA